MELQGLPAVPERVGGKGDEQRSAEEVSDAGREDREVRRLRGFHEGDEFQGCAGEGGELGEEAEEQRGPRGVLLGEQGGGGGDEEEDPLAVQAGPPRWLLGLQSEPGRPRSRTRLRVPASPRLEAGSSRGRGSMYDRTEHFHMGRVKPYFRLIRFKNVFLRPGVGLL